MFMCFDHKIRVLVSDITTKKKKFPVFCVWRLGMKNQTIQIAHDDFIIFISSRESGDSLISCQIIMDPGIHDFKPKTYNKREKWLFTVSLYGFKNGDKFLILRT